MRDEMDKLQHNLDLFGARFGVSQHRGVTVSGITAAAEQSFDGSMHSREYKYTNTGEGL